ncbi:amidotransferase [Campylobacterota bacterium]|nr:amidotransferase [Campylobacterota bacterium]
MRAHILQHIWFEDSGTIAELLQELGWTITVTQFDREGILPKSIDEIDLIVIMGGFMSVNDEDQFGWLGEEKQWIKNAIEAGKKVLGICLGAQLIASSLGAGVRKNPQKEIGWHAIAASAEAVSRGLFPQTATVFHWHGESFDLPDEAVLLASSAACQNQAFAIGSSVIGLQFHLETTPKTAKLLVENCENELVNAPYIQSKEAILNCDAANYNAIRVMMSGLLGYLLDF